jgi:threonine/homoserine/homoserine lactone efflux protein
MEILYALPLGISLSFAAGPVFFMVLQTSISRGKAAAFSFDCGAIFGDIIFILIAYYGSRPLIDGLQNNFWINIASALVIVPLGLYYFFRKQTETLLPKTLQKPSFTWLFVKGFTMNILNVGVFLFWLGITVTVANLLNNEAPRMLLFFAMTLGVYISAELLKIHFANKFQNQIKGKGLQIMEKIVGLILIVLGLSIALKPLWA